MENSSSGTARSGPCREETNDWRTGFTADARLDVRRTVLDKILGSLKIPSSDTDARTRVTKIVEQIEESTFRYARTKDDYICGITRKLLLIENSGHRFAGVSSSNLGLPQNSVFAGGGQSFSLKNVYHASAEFAGDSVRRGLQSNISANNERDIPGTHQSQKVVYQQQQQQESQQLLNHRVHQPNPGTTIHVRDTQNNHQHRQQQHIVSQSSLLCSQNQALPAELQQPPLTEQPGTTVFQHNQLVGQEDNVGQKLSPFWKSVPNSFQQPVGLQSNASCLQQQPSMSGPQLKAVSLKSHEHSGHSFQVEGTSSQPNVEQRVQSVNNFHQLLDSSSHRIQGATTKRPETLASLHTHQNVNNQQKVLPSQKSVAEVSCAVSPVAPLDSAAPSEQANMAEMHDPLQITKKKYFPALTYLYNILNKKCQKSPMQEIVEKYKKKIIAAEKLLKILSMPPENLVLFSMEKLKSFEETLKLFLNSFNQGNSDYVQPPDSPSQIYQLQQHINRECQFHPVNLALTSKQGPSPLSSTQQMVQCSQPNMTNSSCSGSPMELEQQNAPSSLERAARPEDHDIAGAQHIKFTCDTRMKSFDSATKSLHQNSIVNIFHQQEQLKHQMWEQMQMANNEPVSTSGMPQQKPLISQPSEYSHQMPLPVTHLLQSTFAQMSEHSSAPVDNPNLPFLLSKAGTPLHSSGSPSIKSSPSSSFSPFSVLADYKEHPSGSSPLLIPETSGHHQKMFALIAVDTENIVLTQSLSVALPVIAAFLLCTESAGPSENQQSSATWSPLERLLKAVQSVSTRALSAAVGEIGSALKVVDEIAGTVCNDSEAVVGENLQGWNFSAQRRCSFEAKTKRKLCNTSAMAPAGLSFSLSETDNLKQPTGQICDVDSSETSRIKRRRIEPCNSLLDEIKYTNQQLLEIVIDLDSAEDIAAFDHGEGTIVRCAHNAVALSENFKSLYASQMSVHPLRLLVPGSYPNSSPVMLGRFSFDLSDESKESTDLSEKTRSRFSLCLRKLSEPMSLAEMAMTWDACARTVLLECAQSVGAGCFSSRYGKWENCPTA